jgi:hypothetical protein
MNKPVFETFWTVNGEQYFDINEVAELVEAGHLATEISAEKQYREHKLRELQEAWHRQALERHAKYVAEQAHRHSPDGKAEAARLNAAMHPGGIVSGGSHPAFEELDQYGPAATDIFK